MERENTELCVLGRKQADTHAGPPAGDSKQNEILKMDFHMHVGALPVCMSMDHVHAWFPQTDVGSPGTGGTSGC